MDRIQSRAEREWARYAQAHALRSDVHFQIDSNAPLTEQGYRIEADSKSGSITATTPRGLLYGVFRLIQRCTMAGHRLSQIEETADPFTTFRMLWSWGRIDGNYRHPPFAEMRSMIDIAAMGDPEGTPEMMRFLRHSASMGANALAITHELHHFELNDYDQHGFRPYYGTIRGYSDYVRQWGLDLYLYTTAAPERAWRREVADTDCSYDPRVREFVRDYVDEIARELPSVGGLLMVGGLGGYGGGHLYDCDCPHCQGKTPLERVGEQIRIYGEALAAHGMKLAYTLTTDVPFTMAREVDIALDMLGHIPDNVILTFKDCYHDFEDLRYPEHPLFSRLPEGSDGSGLAVEYQLFPEMRGKDSVVSGAANKWSEVFRLCKRRNIRGAIGVMENHPQDDHPTMADWYCFGRLCMDPDADPAVLLKEWALLNYPPKLADTLSGLMLKSSKAAGLMLYAGGVQCGIHGSINPFPHGVANIVNDTWCTVEKHPHGLIGNDNRLGVAYSQERRREIEADPGNLLFIQALMANAEVKAALMAEKHEAVRMYDEIYDTWAEAGEKLGGNDEDSPRWQAYRRLLKMMARNRNDARRFADYFSLFMDWQMNTATLEQVEALRKAHIGTGVYCSISTGDEVFGAQLDRMAKKLQGIPFVEEFDCMYDLPMFTAEQAVYADPRP